MSTNKAHPHAELMRLYAEDAAETDKPWERWETQVRDLLRGEWVPWKPLISHPAWYPICRYRRKIVESAKTEPQFCCLEAKLYAKAIEEAMHYVQTHQDEFVALPGDDKLKIIFDAFMKTRLRVEPALFQGHTMEQWKFMIDGGFICEFSENPFEHVNTAAMGLLKDVTFPDENPFHCSDGDVYNYCRPLRAKGVKQPWFGSIEFRKCPIDENSKAVVFYRNGSFEVVTAGYVPWTWSGDENDIIAFIEL